MLIGSEEELRWVTVPAACRDDEEDDAEGSGCLPEGSGELVLEGGEEEEGSALLPGTTTDDEDFVFVDEKERPRRRGPTSLANFGKQDLPRFFGHNYSSVNQIWNVSLATINFLYDYINHFIHNTVF